MAPSRSGDYDPQSKKSQSAQKPKEEQEKNPNYTSFNLEPGDGEVLTVQHPVVTNEGVFQRSRLGSIASHSRLEISMHNPHTGKDLKREWTLDEYMARTDIADRTFESFAKENPRMSLNKALFMLHRGTVREKVKTAKSIDERFSTNESQYDSKKSHDATVLDFFKHDDRIPDVGTMILATDVEDYLDAKYDAVYFTTDGLPVGIQLTLSGDPKTIQDKRSYFCGNGVTIFSSLRPELEEIPRVVVAMPREEIHGSDELPYHQRLRTYVRNVLVGEFKAMGSVFDDLSLPKQSELIENRMKTTSITSVIEARGGLKEKADPVELLKQERVLILSRIQTELESYLADRSVQEEKKKCLRTTLVGIETELEKLGIKKKMSMGEYTEKRSVGGGTIVRKRRAASA